MKKAEGIEGNRIEMEEMIRKYCLSCFLLAGTKYPKSTGYTSLQLQRFQSIVGWLQVKEGWHEGSIKLVHGMTAGIREKAPERREGDRSSGHTPS